MGYTYECLRASDFDVTRVLQLQIKENKRFLIEYWNVVSHEFVGQLQRECISNNHIL